MTRRSVGLDYSSVRLPNSGERGHLDRRAPLGTRPILKDGVELCGNELNGGIQSMLSKTRGSLCLLVGSLLLALPASPGHADLEVNWAEEAEAVEALSLVPGILNETVTDGPVDLEGQADEPVTFDALPITLSVDGAPDAPLTETDGLAVVGEVGDEATALIQPTLTGARFLTVITGTQAQRTYDYEVALIDGARLRPEDDGSITIVDGTGDSVGQIARPWATDANGNSVPTTYTLDGNKLTQTVELTAAAAFPVVADPKVSSDVCSGRSHTYVVKKYHRAGAVLPLRCGKSSWGYRHLKFQRHRWNASFDSMIALTISRGIRVPDYQQDGGSDIFSLNDGRCRELFRVIYNGAAYLGGEVRPQGVITAYERNQVIATAAPTYRKDCPVYQRI